MIRYLIGFEWICSVLYLALLVLSIVKSKKFTFMVPLGVIIAIVYIVIANKLLVLSPYIYILLYILPVIIFVISKEKVKNFPTDRFFIGFNLTLSAWFIFVRVGSLLL